VKIGLSYFLGQDLAPKERRSSNIGQLVTLPNILGSLIGLTSWQCSIGDMELATCQCVWLTIW